MVDSPLLDSTKWHIAAYLVIINQVGSTKIMDAKSMRRGKNLEKKIIEVLE